MPINRRRARQLAVVVPLYVAVIITLHSFSTPDAGWWRLLVVVAWAALVIVWASVAHERHERRRR